MGPLDLSGRGGPPVRALASRPCCARAAGSARIRRATQQRGARRQDREWPADSARSTKAHRVAAGMLPGPRESGPGLLEQGSSGSAPAGDCPFGLEGLLIQTASTGALSTWADSEVPFTRVPLLEFPMVEVHIVTGRWRQADPAAGHSVRLSTSRTRSRLVSGCRNANLPTVSPSHCRRDEGDLVACNRRAHAS